MEEELPVTVVVTRTPKPGRVQDYEQFLRDVTKVAQRYPGHLGTTVLRPAPPAREYTLIFRFDKVENLRRWEESEERATWVAKAAGMSEGPADIAKLTGMETWFVLPGRTVKPPPRHKMAVVTWLAVFPMVQLLSWLLLPRLEFLPPIGRTLVFSAVMILGMTYLVMPQMTRLFARWLYPS